MNLSPKSIHPINHFGEFCDRGIVFALCASVFVLPAAIAYLESFLALAIFFYLLKKINTIIIEWPLKAFRLNLWGKASFLSEKLAPVDNDLNRPLQFLSAALFISVILSQYPKLSLVAYVGKYLKCVFVYFSFIEAFKDEKRIRFFLGSLAASAMITALSGIFQYYHGKDFSGRHLFCGGRINSFFYTANGLGAYLLPVIGLAAHVLYATLSKKKYWIWAILSAVFLGLLLTCLCWTYSRSSWIGYLVVLIVMVVIDRRKIFFLGALLLVFIFIFQPSLNNVRHMKLISDNNEVSQNENVFQSILDLGGSGRFVFWQKAVSIIQSSPIYGTGLNTYTKIIQRNPDKKTWWYAHNCYLQLAAETGILGLACFLWMLFVLLSHGFKYCGQIKAFWPLTFLQGALCGLVGFMAQSFFDNTFYTVQLAVLMWLMFGFVVAVIRLNPHE